MTAVMRRSMIQAASRTQNPTYSPNCGTESIGAATFIPETTSLSETGTGGCSTPQSGQYRAIWRMRAPQLGQVTVGRRP